MFEIYGVTQDEVNNLLDKIRKVSSTTVTGNNPYTITGDGVEFSAFYNAQDTTLQVTVNKKPFFISIDYIKTSLEEQFNG